MNGKHAIWLVKTLIKQGRFPKDGAVSESTKGRRDVHKNLLMDTTAKKNSRIVALQTTEQTVKCEDCNMCTPPKVLFEVLPTGKTHRAIKLPPRRSHLQK